MYRVNAEDDFLYVKCVGDWRVVHGSWGKGPYHFLKRFKVNVSTQSASDDAGRKYYAKVGEGKIKICDNPLCEVFIHSVTEYYSLDRQTGELFATRISGISEDHVWEETEVPKGGGACKADEAWTTPPRKF